MGGANFVTIGAVPDPQNDLVSGASVSIAATGTVVAPVTGKRITVHGMHLLAAASVTLQVQDVSGSATVNQTGAMTLLPGNPFVLPWANYPYYTCAPGDALVFALGGNIQVSGRIMYVQG